MNPRYKILTVTLVAACSSSAAPLENKGPEPSGMAATVRYLDVEGGCWAVDAADGVRYEPINLPAAFRQDGKKVKIVLRERSDLASVCMVGRIVELVSIQ